jgi:tRNA 2-thiouridine synthesizing protein A
MNATITRSLDLRGVPDGTHLATAAIAMLEVRPGELLEVVTDDPHAPRDFSVWCRASGHQLVAQDQRDGVHHLVIQRQLAGPPAVFTQAELDGLPGPVRRYLRAAIAPGTPLATAVADPACWPPAGGPAGSSFGVRTCWLVRSIACRRGLGLRRPRRDVPASGELSATTPLPVRASARRWESPW